MKAIVNTYALRTTRVDSAALGVLGMVIHPLRGGEADYLGTVLRGGQEAATFRLRVDARSEATQADVDLAAVAPASSREAGRTGPELVVQPEGYLLLYVSEGPPGLSVRLDRLDERKPVRVMDTRSLRAGDLFVVSLLRPGAYVATNQNGEGTCQITVAYPLAGKAPYTPPEPVRVEVTKQGFRPAKVRTGSFGGLIFEIADRAALTVQLAKPDDGPEATPGRARGPIRWVNPSAAGEATAGGAGAQQRTQAGKRATRGPSPKPPTQRG